MIGSNNWQLISYMNEVTALESECYSMKTVINYLESIKVSLYEVPAKFTPPIKPNRPSRRPDPPKPKVKDVLMLCGDAFSHAYNFIVDRCDTGKFVTAGFILLIFVAIVGVNYGTSGIAISVTRMVLVLVVCLTLLFVFFFLAEKQQYDSENMRYKNIMRKNEMDYMSRSRETITMYERHLSDEKRKFYSRKNEIIVYNQIAYRANSAISEAQGQLRERLSRMSEVLDSLYGMGFIYPKYRNWVAVSSFYEYLDSGRCEKLEGASGAYNIYENELRMDRVIDKIDVIISRLDTIASTQYKLYREMKRVNANIDILKVSIRDDLRAIKRQTEASAGQIGRLSGHLAEARMDVEKGIIKMDGYLSKLDQTSNKALAYLAAQR